MPISLMTLCKMRKYHQLLLCIITIISSSTLFVYRYEYLKLRYVLEVLNYFGSPQGGGEDCLVLNESVMANERDKHIFAHFQPTWISVGQHFVYSSYWENEGDKFHVRALAAGPPSAFTNFECHIWFDQGDSLSSVLGKFGYSLRNVPKYFNESKEHTINFYELFCEPVETLAQGLPYGLLLIYKRDLNKLKKFIPIHKPAITKKNKIKKVVVCVQADMTGAAKSSIIEFVSFHQAVGVTDFIFYDNGLQYKILSMLETFAGTKGFSESVSVLNWNFPFNDQDAENTILEMDCIARVSGQVEVVAILNLDEYIVPKVHHTIKEMLYESSPSKRIPVKFELESLICCTDLKDDKRAEKSWPVALRKTQLMSIQVKKQIIVHYPLVSIEPSNHKLPVSSGVIHIYRPCSGLKTITKYDPTMARYLGNFMTSKLLGLWKSGSLLKESQKI